MAVSVLCSKCSRGGFRFRISFYRWESSPWRHGGELQKSLLHYPHGRRTDPECYRGQANHFARYAADKKDHYATQRYVGETERLYGILNERLSGGREYVAGKGPKGRFSIADMAIIGWADVTALIGLDLAADFPNVEAWIARCRQRPAVQRGMAVPNPGIFSNEIVRSDPQMRAAAAETKKFVDEAKAMYGYKYTSP